MLATAPSAVDGENVLEDASQQRFILLLKGLGDSVAHDNKINKRSIWFDEVIDKIKGGPVGITTIATAIGEDAGTLEDVYEPYLLQIGFINRTPRGRVATQKAYEHLKINYQEGLFD